jgi:uncharacterized protein YgbK (DUF1537 family)
MTWAVLADDFTGALDTGLQFARRGLKTIFDLGINRSRSDAIVLSSDSRSLPPTLAAAAAAETAKQAALSASYFYKKLDSTLRGNIGPELAAVMAEIGSSRCILAPAYPAQGRTTIGGIQYINGCRITDTEISQDPQSPVTNDNIIDIIASTSILVPALLPLATTRSGPQHIARCLQELDATADVIVADAETDADLASIAQAARLASMDRLTAGSAGLAEHLIDRTGAYPFPIIPTNCRYVVIIAGSFSAVTKVQVATAASVLGASTYIPSIDEYPNPNIALIKGIECLKRDGFWIAHPGAARSDLSIDEIKALTEWIGTLTTGINDLLPDVGFILTGGETASLAITALEATGIRIAAEINPGIPGGLLVGGTAANNPIVTKAGAFGNPTALLNASKWLKVI